MVFLGCYFCGLEPMKFVLNILILGLLATLVSCKSEGEKSTGKNGGTGKTLVITAISDEKGTNQEARFAALGTYLAKELEIPTKFRLSSTYEDSVTRFKNGEVHLVWYGGLSGVQARKAVPGARAIAQGDVDPQYKSYFIANSSTGLTLSPDFPGEKIKDLTFSFGSRSSTSGRLMPAYFIRENTNQMPAKFFSQPVQFSTGHDATAKAVESGSVQVGAMNYKTYDSMVKEGKLDPEKARIIWVTPEYADYNLTVHPALEDMFGEGFIDKLQKVLVDCTDKDVLAAFDRDDLIPARNEEFEGIEKVALELGLMR